MAVTDEYFRPIEKRIAELEKENTELRTKTTALENANRAMVKELDDMTRRKTGNKYHNQKTVIGDMVFDSKKEANRFQELKLLERGGVISGLKTQVRFLICPKSGGNKRARYYVADFVYTEGGKTIIEDVKSEITRKNAVYSLKKALVQWQYPEYIFRES